MMRRYHAFTLLELITVIAIIALLVALVVPAIYQADSAVKGMRCLGNMRSIGQAIMTYGKDGNPLAGNFRDSDPRVPHWVTIGPTEPLGEGGTSLAGQTLDGLLVKRLEYNRKVFLCPLFESDANLGGDKVACHYAIPTILSGMPLSVMRSAFYRSSKDGDIPLPGVPLVVEPAVYKDDSGTIVNSLGTYDLTAKDEKENLGSWSKLPTGGFDNVDKLDARRHSKRVHMAFHNGGATAVDLKDLEIYASKIFIVVDDGSIPVRPPITCGYQNSYNSWQN